MVKEEREMLTFGKANAKHEELTNEDFNTIAKSLPDIFGSDSISIRQLFTFSLPAGWTCPGALECQAWSDPSTGKIKDGANQTFRCFAASMEAVYTNTRESRWNNFNQLKNKTSNEMADLIVKSLPAKAKIVRVHVSGDFFSADYLRAWCIVAERIPSVLFYAYTKSLHFLDKIRGERHIPINLQVTASRGGKHDNRIDLMGLRSSRVLFEDDGSLIDHNDINAMVGMGEFGLLIHGVQPKGTPAATALKALKST